MIKDLARPPRKERVTVVTVNDDVRNNGMNAWACVIWTDKTGATRVSQHVTYSYAIAMRLALMQHLEIFE